MGGAMDQPSLAANPPRPSGPEKSLPDGGEKNILSTLLDLRKTLDRFLW